MLKHFLQGHCKDLGFYSNGESKSSEIAGAIQGRSEGS